jgi:hypothetical protein
MCRLELSVPLPFTGDRAGELAEEQPALVAKGLHKVALPPHGMPFDSGTAAYALEYDE